MTTNPPLAHLAGAVVQCGSVIRQRCDWCGAALIDQDLTRTAVCTPEGGDTTYPTWPVGEWVEVDGAATWVVTRPIDGSSPETSCMRLDPAVTR